MSTPEAVARRKAARSSKVVALQRRAQALDLRRKGYSYAQIAAELGVGVATAHKAVQDGCGEIQALAREDADAIVALELDRLDAMLAGVWHKASTGSTPAIRAALQISQRRMKILGLEREKLEMSGPGGGPIQIDSSSYERIKARLGKYRQDAAA